MNIKEISQKLIMGNVYGLGLLKMPQAYKIEDHCLGQQIFICHLPNFYVYGVDDNVVQVFYDISEGIFIFDSNTIDVKVIRGNINAPNKVYFIHKEGE